MVQDQQPFADYTTGLSPQRKERVEALHRFIIENFPSAQVSLKYKMPTYEFGKGWIAVASQKNYVSLYTCAREHIQSYLDIHPKVKHGTGCINFRDGDEIAWADLGPVLASAFNKDD